MRQNMLQAYEQGYSDGLQEVLAELLDGFLTSTPAPQKNSQPEIAYCQEYHNGFSEGLKDGTEVLLALGKTLPTKCL